MNENSFTPSGKHLFELIQNKKYKDYKFYLAAIENQEEKAEKAISAVFR